MTSLVIATRNAGKIAEIARILRLDGSGQEQIEIRSIADFEIGDVEETGSSFEENALLKALTIARATGMPALADDSGLAVDALGGAPGIFSARYSGAHGDDLENMKKLLTDLAATNDPERGARFIAVIAVARPDGSSITSRGELLGSIAHAPRGEYGFGYDPVFIPKPVSAIGFSDSAVRTGAVRTGAVRTLGEFLPAEKDAISHRAKALAEIAPRIAPFIQATIELH